MSTRRIIATYAFVMFFLVIALLGTVTAAFGGTSYTEAAGRQSLYTLTAAKARGTIYDRNLQPLTNAERVYAEYPRKNVHFFPYSFLLFSSLAVPLFSCVYAA